MAQPPKKVEAAWKQKGIYRLNIELPADLWSKLCEHGRTIGLRPSQVVRMILSEQMLKVKAP